jgi:hypothetical protein
MSNPFSSLAPSCTSDDENESQRSSSQDYEQDNDVPKDHVIPKQNGGSFALRVDPIIGANFSGSSQIDLGISDTDISTTNRVISVLTSNIHFFKLSKFKSLRAALHPLVIEQMKNYDTKDSNAGSNGKRANKRKRKPVSGTSTIDELHKIQKQKLSALEEAYINQVLGCIYFFPLGEIVPICFHALSRHADPAASPPSAATGRAQQRRICSKGARRGCYLMHCTAFFTRYHHDRRRYFCYW